MIILEGENICPCCKKEHDSMNYLCNECSSHMDKPYVKHQWVTLIPFIGMVWTIFWGVRVGVTTQIPQKRWIFYISALVQSIVMVFLGILIVHFFKN